LRGQSDGQYGPRQPRATKLDDFKPQLLDRLERAGQHQLPATVLLRELRERGYDGGVTQLKDYLRSIRPAHVQAHLQLRFAAIAAQQQRANYNPRAESQQVRQAASRDHRRRERAFWQSTMRSSFSR